MKNCRLKAFVGILSLFLIIFLLNISKQRAIEQYLQEHELWLDGTYSVPYNDLRWSFLEIEVSNSLTESGWDISDINLEEKVLINDKEVALSNYIDVKTGELKDGMLLATLTVVVTAEKSDSILDEKATLFPADLIKLGNKKDVNSFLEPVLPIAFSTDNGKPEGKYIYIEPNLGASIRFLYLFDEKNFGRNGYFFANVIPTQTVSICFPLEALLKNK